MANQLIMLDMQTTIITVILFVAWCEEVLTEKVVADSADRRILFLYMHHAALCTNSSFYYMHMYVCT